MRGNHKEDIFTVDMQILILTGIIVAFFGSLLGVWRCGLFAGMALEMVITYTLAHLGRKLIL